MIDYILAYWSIIPKLSVLASLGILFVILPQVDILNLIFWSFDLRNLPLFFRSISSFEWWNILNVFYIWNIYWNCNMDLEPWHVIHQIYGPPRRRRKFKTLGSFSFGIVETYFPYTVTWLVKQEKLCRHHSSCVAGMAVQHYPTFLKNRLLLFLGW